MAKGNQTGIELWAGPECTLNRVGNASVDQFELSGHLKRIEDLNRIAELGVRRIRYPVHWERVEPDGPERPHWQWADERLARLRELGLPPIVGLVHHGSGPRSTSLIDASFASGLAAFARAVAERYPWVDAFTPVNEPLTTARFSGLYGHWYPHGRDDRSFLRALVTQCRATILAMREIRHVNAAARLVQTEDLGKTHSTPLLAYQAAFENERRWLTLDLLCGRLDRAHPLWEYLRSEGIGTDELEWFLEHACPPDIIGINHYLSGERFLDERLDRYPPESHGGNGRHTYADVLAARVLAEGPAGPRTLLQETWERYRLPVAVTEAHNGCTREEQLRWLQEIWDAAVSLRQSGVDIRAVTVWSVFGAYGWDHLVTQPNGRYEPGVFDLRGPAPRPTALAQMARGLATQERYEHPVLASPGWWRRPERLWYPPVCVAPAPRTAETGRRELRGASPHPLLITGMTGTLGRAVARICDERGLPYRLTARAEFDIANSEAVAAILTETSPWAVINTAGYVRVDEAESDAERCLRENSDGPALLAAACAERGIRFVTFSSDLVFDGAKGAPYIESDAVAPLNVYGRSKAEAEQRVLKTLPEALVVRTSAFFGPWDDYNFLAAVRRVLRAGDSFVAAGDATVSPTYVPDLAQAALDLLIDGERGLWHLANPGAITWVALARLLAMHEQLPVEHIEARPTSQLGLPASRPLYSVLASERGTLLPPFDDAFERYRAAVAGATT